MKPARKVLAAIVVAVAAWSALAADNTLLIQLEADGKLKVWHSEGETKLADDELDALEASARPDGGEEMHTAAGAARAYATPSGVTIAFPGARADKALLIDRDACGGLRIWHAAGATALTDDQLTELVLTALPDGGKRVAIGEGRYAKGYTIALGVAIVIWKPPAR